MDLLALFADFAELSRNRPAGDERHTELRVHSSREYFHTYLRSLDPDRGALPDHFRDKLLRVLAHYGITDLERTPELGHVRLADEVTTLVVEGRVQEEPLVLEAEMLARLADPALAKGQELLALGQRPNGDGPFLEGNRHG